MMSFDRERDLGLESGLSRDSLGKHQPWELVRICTSLPSRCQRRSGDVTEHGIRLMLALFAKEASVSVPSDSVVLKVHVVLPLFESRKTSDNGIDILRQGIPIYSTAPFVQCQHLTSIYLIASRGHPLRRPCLHMILIISICSASVAMLWSRVQPWHRTAYPSVAVDLVDPASFAASKVLR